MSQKISRPLAPNNGNRHKTVPESVLETYLNSGWELVQIYPRGDKAVISVLYDSECRIGEILILMVKDVEFDEFGMRLTGKGKTGVRKVRAVGDSVQLMREYLQAYSRTNPDDHVFIQLAGSRHGEPMKWSQVNTMLRNVPIRARIGKRIHVHLFRHIRPTILSKDVKEAPLEATMWRAHGSKMARVYVHIDADDVGSAILKVYGIEKQIDRERNVTYVPKVCPMCKEVNSNISSYCSGAACRWMKSPCWSSSTPRGTLKGRCSAGN